MEITKINVEHASKGSFQSSTCDGLRHIKVLPYLSVVQAVEGSYDIRLGGGETQNTAWRGFFIAPSNVRQVITHNIDPVSGHMHCRWVFLKVKMNDTYTLDNGYRFPVILPEPFKSRLDSLFDRLFSADNVFDEYIGYYEMVKLLSQVATEDRHRAPSFVEEVLTYMKEHYAEKIAVADMAKVVNVSESHLFSVFKKEMGVSPLAYLNNYRLSLAAEQLLNTHKTVAEIAGAVGVDDAVYFNKLFRKWYRLSPTAYRKIHKTTALPA